MYDDMMKKGFAQFEKSAEPIRRFAELAAAQTEKVTHFQLDASRAYVDMGVEQMRAAASVRDAESLQSFVNRQREAASNFGRRLTDDVETFAGFGKDFSEAVTKLTEETVSKTQPAATAKSDKSAA